MDAPTDKHDEEAEAVGVLLAEAFVARVSRFSPALRTRLLVACRHRLLQADPAIAELLFKGDSNTGASTDTQGLG